MYSYSYRISSGAHYISALIQTQIFVHRIHSVWAPSDMSFFCVRFVAGTKHHNYPNLEAWVGLGTLIFILYVEEKSYTEFVLTGIEPEFSSWKAST